jgi:hypothetical protein
MRLALLGCTGLAAILATSACAPRYTRAEVVYAEPARHVYVVAMERALVVTREVLVRRGWTVLRVERRGRDRIVWARRGPDEIVRIFLTPQGNRVIFRGLREGRGTGRRWERRGDADDLIVAIGVRLG